MTVNKILPAVLATTALLSVASCNNKTKPEDNSTQTTEILNKDTVMPKYADLAIYFDWESKEKTNLKVEDGVSFIADGIKYTSRDGKINGEFIDTIDSPKSIKTFVTDQRSFASPTYQTIKMVADYTQEQENKDTLILSKDDIKQAQSKIKSGAIWNEGKEYFAKEGENSQYIGKANITNTPNGAELSVNYMTSELSQTKFYYE